MKAGRLITCISAIALALAVVNAATAAGLLPTLQELRQRYVGALPPVAALGMAPCVGAMHAKMMAAQERQTPDGEWYQRPVPDMPKKAHACACHEHNCSDPDPDHVSAHTDSQCLNFCTVAKCSCERMDCP